ncbi:DUF4832 domain-containing protein [Photobacterium kishitanii]|uniref:DUF4832 domain-containing protein n=1 Tax=Photobacterium kishitanii TaxID=318456 RepID=A0A2T3KLZ8_9GAMM|nr:DUF4832 domain-containing protein [Photobacterium kishitanii]PSV00699.1 hypothetical protein C9J27_06040 [Photobacterium kishitanii]
MLTLLSLAGCKNDFYIATNGDSSPSKPQPPQPPQPQPPQPQPPQPQPPQPPQPPKILMTTIQQAQTDVVIANPDRGFQQFTWVHDENQSSKDYIAASTLYVRYNWAQIEAQEGNFDFSVIEHDLQEAKSHGMKLAFRIMAMEFSNDWGSHSALPKWLLDKSYAKKYKNTIFPIPDYTQQRFLDALEILVKNLAQRYDNTNDISSIDVGIVGSWGEWNLADAKSTPVELHNNKLMFSDYDRLNEIPIIFKKHFKHVPILMLIGNNNEPFLGHAVENGTGWRADCFGDLGTTSDKWNNMDAYTSILEQAENNNQYFNDSWKQTPINFEICYSLDKWVEFGYTREQVENNFNWALEHHVSSVDFTDGGVPSQYRDLVDSFSKKMGYRFVIKAGEFQSSVASGSRTVKVITEWQNIGSAPTYYDYKLAFKIKDNKTGKYVGNLTTTHGTNALLPPDIYGNESDVYSFTDSIPLILPLIPKHTYSLMMSFVNDKGKSSIKLPTTLKEINGWYEIGTVVSK